MYEFFEHTADLGLRARADDRNALFAEMAKALFSAIVEEVGTVQPVVETTVAIDGADLEYLMFDWLRELLFRFDSEHWVYSKFEVNVSDTGLTARAWGERLDPARHELTHEVKAITYHALKVERDGDGWLAEAIVDI